MTSIAPTICYHVHQSRRNGKLTATRTSLRKNLRCTHRSDEKAVHDAAVSCVGRVSRGCRDVADMPRWFSGTAWLPSDRQRLTIAYSRLTKDKSGQRPPATQWAMHRKVCRVLIERTSQTKTLRFGFTERAALCLVAIEDQHEQTERIHAEGQPEAIARHGSVLRTLAQKPFSAFLTAENPSLFGDLHSSPNPESPMNMNDLVQFILTPAGEAVIRRYDASCNNNLPAAIRESYGMDWFKHHEPIDDKGTRSEQLWHLFEMFGPHTHMAGNVFFVNNELVTGVPDE